MSGKPRANPVGGMIEYRRDGAYWRRYPDGTETGPHLESVVGAKHHKGAAAVFVADDRRVPKRLTLGASRDRRVISVAICTICAVLRLGYVRPAKKHYTVADLAEMAELSPGQVRRMLERHGFERPAGPRTKWLIAHSDLMAKVPSLVGSHRQVEAIRKRERTAA